jgi:hypothetical protein
MAIYCIGSYIVVTLIISVFVWSALVVSKKDDVSQGFNLIEDTRAYEIENHKTEKVPEGFIP